MGFQVLQPFTSVCLKSSPQYRKKYRNALGSQGSGTPARNRTGIRGLEIRCSIHLSYGSASLEKHTRCRFFAKTHPVKAEWTRGLGRIKLRAMTWRELSDFLHLQRRAIEPRLVSDIAKLGEKRADTFKRLEKALTLSLA